METYSETVEPSSTEVPSAGSVLVTMPAATVAEGSSTRRTSRLRSCSSVVASASASPATAGW